MDNLGAYIKKFKVSREFAKYVQKEQAKHPEHFLQPGMKGFKEVYGERIKKQQAIKQKQERDSKILWEEAKRRREYEAKIRARG